MKVNINITNPNKYISKKDNIKKIDVINYYNDISILMLPFIKKRVLSVIRSADGINDCFIKKHPTNDKDFVDVINKDNQEYFYIHKKEQLVYQAQFNTIEFHVGANVINKSPNIMIFDLDPDEKMSLKKLRELVLKFKSVLDDLKIKSFLKTSGGKGYHIVIPFKSNKDYNYFYEISKKIANIAEAKWPNYFTTNIKKNKRKGKVFIDYLRNNNGSTCVAPYSLRAREKLTISMPISYDDINKIAPNEVTIKNYKKYLNDSWDDFFKVNQKLK